VIVKPCVAGVLALALGSPQPQVLGTTIAFTHHPYIEKISCDRGSGTGFKLDTGTWVSVDHVTSLGNCTVDGIPIVVTHADKSGDFSTFVVPGDRRRGGIKANCEGYKEGRWYHGQGHARGLSIVTSVPVLFLRVLNQQTHPKGFKALAYNRYIPGQSGGPSFNDNGEAVGTVNAFLIFYPVSLSKQLKDTIVCQK
jgi:hypothetical protein